MLAAPAQDLQIAKSSKVIEEKPAAAPAQDVEALAKLINVPQFDNDRGDGNRGNFGRGNDGLRLAGDRDWNRNIKQWRPDWVDYDEYYRPVISNPFRDAVRIVYLYQNLARIVWIPPLARVLLEVPLFAAYSFTAVVANAVNTVTDIADIAVGTFLGGGYYPSFGQPFPEPPRVQRYDNVPVQVRYSDATYEPFRVQRIVDVGNDAQYGERKVLLDGVTPAWGEWTQTPGGERQFEVHKTQQFPGLAEPAQGPLAGGYDLRLASDESSSGLDRRDIYLMTAAGLCAVLSLGAVLLTVLLGRRRRAA